MSNFSHLNTFDLSFTQRDIYLNQLKFPNNPCYNIGGYIRMGKVDIERLTKAHEFMVQGHDAFGIRIVTDGEKVCQYISEQRDTGLPLIDFSQEANPQHSCDTWLKQQFSSYIDFENGPLFRSFILKLSEQSYRYVSYAHHIGVDGWGFANLARLIGVYYHQIASKGGLEHESQPKWQQIVEQDMQYQQGKRYQASAQFWQDYLDEQQFDKLVSPYHLSEFASKVNIPSERQIITLEADKVLKLKGLASDNGVGITQLLIGVIGAYFAKRYQQKDLVFGVPVHNRSGFEQKQMLAVFTSISPLLLSFDNNADMPEVMMQIAQNQKRCFRHQRFPIGDIYQLLNRSSATSGLFDIGFNYLHLDSFLSFESKPADLVYLTHHHEQLPMMINVWEYGDSNQIELQLDHNLAYFDRADGQLILSAIDNMLNQFISQPQRKLADYSPVSCHERQMLNRLATPVSLPDEYLNRGDKDYMLSDFEYLADTQPNATAIMFTGTNNTAMDLSYRQLNEKANQLAHYLLQKLQSTITDGQANTLDTTPIGVCLHRDLNLPIALLAVLKAGCAYVPIDPKLPEAKRQYIIQSCGIELLLINVDLGNEDNCNEKGNENDSLTVINLDEISVQHQPLNNPNIAKKPQALGYIIYTSGSTGDPKGVEVYQANASAFIAWAKTYFTKEQSRCVLWSTSISFDLSVFELFYPLSIGTSCYLVDNIIELGEQGAQKNMHLNQSISLINTVPSAMKALLELDVIEPNVNTINLAGEALSRDLLNQIFTQYQGKNPNLIVNNLYGPSEDTTYSLAQSFSGAINTPVPIGQAITGSAVAVLDSQGEIVPVGTVGELYLTGAGVTRGYRNAPDITAARFVELDLFGKGSARYYQTGDMVRLDASGCCFYMGRIDEQLKIDGFRIEPGEIEAAILQHPWVEDVVVLALELTQNSNEGKVLVAYVVANNELAHDALGTWLTSRIASYMMPKHFCQLKALPLNANGKVDKKQLPSLAQLASLDNNANQPVSADVSDRANTHWTNTQWTETEQKLLTIWQQLLPLKGSGNNEQIKIGKHESFFTLGGSSLKGMSLLSRINQTFNVQLSIKDIFATNTIAAQAKLIANSTTSVINTIEKLAQNSAPLSFTQQRFWLIEQMYANQNPFNMVSIFKLKGQLDVAALQLSLDKLLQRHRILHTNYRQTDDGVEQWVNGEHKVILQQHTLPKGDVNTQLQLLFVEQLSHSFDLATDVMLRAFLYQDTQAKQPVHYLMVATHHIAMDGWSVQLLFKDWSALYCGQSLTLAKVEYTDFAHWQRNLPDNQQSLAYWRERLANAPICHSLPLDGQRYLTAKSQGRRLTGVIDTSLTTKLNTLASQLNVTLFSLLKSALVLVLGRFSRQNDLVIGVPVAGRGNGQLDHLIGAFINTLACRSKIDQNSSFTAWCQRQHQEFIDDLAHQDLSFDKLVAHLPQMGSQAHAPVFQVLFDYNDQYQPALELPGLEVSQVETDAQVSKYDFELYLRNESQQIKAEWVYSPELFDSQSVCIWWQAYLCILESIVTEPKTKNAELNITDAGQYLLWQDYNRHLEYTGIVSDDSNCDGDIVNLIIAQCHKTPDAIAFVCQDKNYSYADMAGKVASYGQQLQQHNLTDGAKVGLMMSRRAELFISMVAVLAVGGCFVPMDPSLAPERLKYISDNCELDGLMFGDETAAEIEAKVGASIAKPLVLIDVNQCSNAKGLSAMNSDFGKDYDPQSWAYILHTSGSTGEPKGVPITRAAISNLIVSLEKFLNLPPQSRWLALTTMSFDIAILEWLMPLVSGGCCVVASEQQSSNPEQLIQLLEREQVNVLSSTPSRWQQLLDFGWQGNQNLSALSAGERLTLQLQEQLCPKVAGLVNAYGPTEATIYATINKVNMGSAIEERLSIGHSLNNYTVAVVDEQNQLLPLGAIGELVIAGVAVTPGYLNQPQLNQAKFFSADFVYPSDMQGMRFYKTGDLARVTTTGICQYINRLDDQLKIRGALVEPKEIEQVLNTLEGVQQAIVRPVYVDTTNTIAISVKDANTLDADTINNSALELVAYILPSEPLSDYQASTGDQIQLRAAIDYQLKQHLPAYMVPRYVEFISEIPLNHNGKIDSKALPLPNINLTDDIVVAQTVTEQKLCEVWARHLGCDVNRVCVQSDFFTLGGHSMLLAHLIRDIRQQFNGLELSLSHFMTDSRIRAVAQYIDEQILVQELTVSVKKKQAITI